MDAKLIRQVAEQELYDENFKRLVAEEKQRILTKRSLWSKLFPFKISITRRK